MFIEKVKCFITRVIPVKISAGHGVSFTDDKITPPTQEKIQASQTTRHYTHRLKQGIGDFELIDLLRSQDHPRYVVRHILTGQTFTVTRNIFVLLFERNK